MEGNSGGQLLAELNFGFSSADDLYQRRECSCGRATATPLLCNWMLSGRSYGVLIASRDPSDVGTVAGGVGLVGFPGPFGQSITRRCFLSTVDSNQCCVLYGSFGPADYFL